MIYLTGDTHGDFRRIELFCEHVQSTKEDVLIILGDVGANYYLNKTDERNKAYLAQLPITLLCIHGNHEQRPWATFGYEEKNWRGGSVYVQGQYPNILFAKDGEVYDFEGKKAIAIGGAYSVDKYYRIVRGWPWFDTEQPTEEIKTFVEQKLEEHDWKVDYVLSHTVPLKYEPVEVFLPMIDQSTVDKSTEEWLDKLEEKMTYEKWYCGHYHTTKCVDKIRLMFLNYAVLGDDEKEI